jgi:hypothetical protein
MSFDSSLPRLPASPIMPAMIGADTLVPSASQKTLPQGVPASWTCTSIPGSATAARSATARLAPHPTEAARDVCHTPASSYGLQPLVVACQASSSLYWPLEVSSSSVPPTASTLGIDAGKKTRPV